MTGVFEHGEWTAYWILGWLAAAVWIAAGWLARRRRMRRLLGAQRADRRVVVGADVVLLAALGLIAIALLGPRLAEREIRVSGTGADVVLLFDVSQSMDARDSPPSRMARARAGAAGLLERLSPGDRVALAGFAGRGVAFTPLTADRHAIAQMLPALDSRLIEPGGSDLHAGLEAIWPLFEAGSERPRIVLVWSDGEVSAPAKADALELISRKGVRVLSVAIGDDAGAPVPDGAAPLRDDHDRVVTSRRTTVALTRLAEASDGRVWQADRWGEVDLAALARAVDRDVSREAGAVATPATPTTRRVAVAAVRPFAAVAFALLLAEALIGPLARQAASRRARPSAGGSRLRRMGVVVLPFALLAGLGADMRGRSTPASARAHALRGLALAHAGETERARHAFDAAAVLAVQPSLLAVAHYNLGVLALEREDLETARDRFFDALARTPDDHAMRFNLEWTLLALQARDDPKTQEPVAGDTPPGAAEPSGEPDQSRGETDLDMLDEPRPDAAADPESEPAGRESEGGTGSATSELATPSRPLLDENARRRWLDRVRDDPGRAMRLTSETDGGAGRRPRRGGATW